MLETNVGPGWLARALLTLARRGASGEVGVEAPGGLRAAIRLFEGRIASVDHRESDGSVLGDLLLDEGALARELLPDDDGRAESEPIGRFLVRTGRVTRGALEHALRRQVRVRLRTVFSWERPRLGFRALEVTAADLTLPVADAVLDALRHTAAQDVEPRLPERETWALSSFGRDLLREAALRPEEAAVAAMLERGVAMDTIASVLNRNPRAMRFAAMLRRIGAVEPSHASGSYSLLLQKRQQLRRSSDPRMLLGLPPGASKADARRALRRLARDLHPDRFSQADAAARTLSAEVLRALVAAEANFASGAAPPRSGRAK